MGELFKVVIGYKFKPIKFLGLIVYYSENLKNLIRLNIAFFQGKKGFLKGFTKV